MKKTSIIILFLLANLSVFCQEVPNITTRVTDKAGLLSSSQKQAIEEKLHLLEKEKGSQVVVIIIPTTEQYSIEEYAFKLAEKAKAGRKNMDDGVIMLFAMDDRKMRIEVGYGLEGAIPDAQAKRIINEIIVPKFRAGHFYKGIDNGVNKVLDLIRVEEFVTTQESDTEKVYHDAVKSTNSRLFGQKMFIAIALIWLGVLVTCIYLLAKKYSINSKDPKEALTANIIAFIMCCSMGLIIGPILFLLLKMNRGKKSSGSFTSYSSSDTSYSSNYSSSSLYSSSSYSSSSSSISSYSGGGGRFGGGGASGSW